MTGRARDCRTKNSLRSRRHRVATTRVRRGQSSDQPVVGWSYNGRCKMNRQTKKWFAPAVLLGTAMAFSAACGSVGDATHARRDPNDGIAQNTAAIVITAGTID